MSQSKKLSRVEWPLFGKDVVQKRPIVLALVTLALLPLIVFFALLGNPFLWSEYDLVPRGGYSNTQTWKDAFTTDSIRESDPLSIATYHFEDSLPGPTSVTHRSINLILHITAALLLSTFLRLLRAPGAYLTALIFVIHPTVIQTLFWPGYRSEIIALVLILLALILGFRNKHSADYFCSLGITALACILNPVAIVIPIFIALSILYRERFPRLTDFNRVLPMAGIAVFIVAWTGFSSTSRPIGMPSSISLSQVGENLFFFFNQAFLPLESNLFHPYEVGPSYEVSATFSFLPFLVFIPFYILVIFQHRRIWGRSILFGLTAFLLLASYGAFHGGHFLDHSTAHEDALFYLALPAALAFVICHLASYFEYVNRALRPIGIIAAFLILVMEIALSAAFANTLTKTAPMWQSIEQTWPESWIPKAALVEIQLDEGTEIYSQEEFIEAMVLIVEKKPDSTEDHQLLARTYALAEQNSNALREYKRILRESEPDDSFIEEAAQFFDKVGLSRDAQIAREQIQNN